MQHVHYDLDQIEKDLRHMFATAPAESIHSDPDVVDVFRRSVEVEAAFCRFTLSEIMAGTNPGVMLDALTCIFANLIINRMQSFGPDDDGNHPADDFIMKVATAVIVNFEHRKEPSQHATTCSPVVSGRA